MRAVLATLVLPIVCTDPAPAQTAPEAIKAFQAAFKPSRSAPDAGARRAALDAMTAHDSQEVAKALVGGHVQVQREMSALDEERVELAAELEKLVGKQKFSNSIQLMPPQLARYNELRQLIAARRDMLDTRREELTRIGQVLSERRDAGAVAWMVKTVSGSSKHPLLLKIKVAQAAGGTGAAVVPDMVAALQRTKVPEEAAALLDGIGLAGADARAAAAETVVGLLRHDSALVKEHAALACSTLCDPRAIEPMIEALASSHGQTRKRIGAALEILTRQQHGTSAPTWQRWFAAEKDKLLAGSVQLGGGTPSRTERPEGGTGSDYFGIPQDGRSIVYVIDSSDSMKAPIELRLPRREPGDSKPAGGTSAGSGQKPGDPGSAGRKTTRLEACKEELIRALGRLEPTTMFNVIWYSDLPHQLKPGMIKASPRAVKAAQEWVRQLQPNKTTNIHDSMQMAFELTGQLPQRGKPVGPLTGKGKQVRAAAPDTIFLLSDGSPTLPTGKLDSTKKIIDAVRTWNALKSVVIHCIGIGQGINEPFMRQLATENGGEFRRY